MLRAYHILLLVTLLSTTSNGYGQSKYIDSLKAAALVATDTSKVNALNKLASAHWYIDPLITVRIAWAHLKEFPDYYDRLARMEAEAEGKPAPAGA